MRCASIPDACFDLWAKNRGVPLWKLLIISAPEEVASLLDLTYVEELLCKEGASRFGPQHAFQPGPSVRSVLTRGYPGYDTSVAGWPETMRKCGS